MASCIHGLLAQTKNRRNLAKRGLKFCEKCNGTGKYQLSRTFTIKTCPECNGHGFYR